MGLSFLYSWRSLLISSSLAVKRSKFSGFCFLSLILFRLEDFPLIFNIASSGNYSLQLNHIWIISNRIWVRRSDFWILRFSLDEGILMHLKSKLVVRLSTSFFPDLCRIKHPLCES